MSEKRIDYLDIAKGIGIILVVLGHSFPDASYTVGIQNPICKVIFELIYTFHMPLFFFISGYLSPKLVIQKEKKMILKRISSLLIPYLFMSMLYVPLRLLLSNMANSSWNLQDIWKILIGISPNRWGMVFICFIIM